MKPGFKYNLYATAQEEYNMTSFNHRIHRMLSIDRARVIRRG
jgi:hypothetical protein